MKIIVTTLVVLAVLFATLGAAYASVGARPLGMGGAFIALSDDANATYWNPAGLAQIPVGATLGTWTHTANNSEEIRLHEFASLVSSFAGFGPFKKIALGASCIADDVDLPLGIIAVDDERESYWASIGVDTGSLGMFGVNARKIHHSIYHHTTGSDWAIDASYLCKLGQRFSIGVLAQDVNEPTLSVSGYEPLKAGTNWRGGIAYRPTSDTVIAIDGYDLADNLGQKSARVGVEQIFRNFTLRAGYIGLGSDDVQKGATIGIGLSRELYDIDAVVLTGDFDNAIMVSAGFKMF